MEWLALDAARGRLDRLVEKADDLAKRAGKRGLGDRLAILLALEMDVLSRELLEPEADPEKRWQRVRELHREVSRLRRDDDRVTRTRLREKRDKARGQRLRAEGGDPSSLRYDAASEDEAYWNQVEPPPQGIEAAREAMAAMGGNPSSQGDGAASEDEDEQETASEDGLRQVKVGQGGNDVQNPRAKGQSPGAKVQFLLEERKPCLDEPGCEILFTQDNTYGTRYRKVPIGWQDPEGISPAMQKEELRMKNGAAEVQGPGSKGQSLGTGGGTPPEPAGGDACATILRPSVPYVPDPDPEVEAYNRWWRMNQNFERFDYEELQRVYAELPQKIAEYQARLRRELGAGELARRKHGGGGGSDSKKVPNSKHQAPEKHQISNTNYHIHIEHPTSNIQHPNGEVEASSCRLLQL